MSTPHRFVGLVPLLTLFAPVSAAAEDLVVADTLVPEGAGEMTAGNDEPVCAAPAGGKKTPEPQSSEGFAAAGNVKAMGTLGTIGFGLGLTGLAAGTVLLLTVPSSKDTGGARRWVSLNIFKLRADGAIMGLKGAF